MFYITSQSLASNKRKAFLFCLGAFFHEPFYNSNNIQHFDIKLICNRPQTHSSNILQIIKILKPKP